MVIPEEILIIWKHIYEIRMNSLNILPIPSLEAVK
jgi:hypothetical protein